MLFDPPGVGSRQVLAHLSLAGKEIFYLQRETMRKYKENKKMNKLSKKYQTIIEEVQKEFLLLELVKGLFGLFFAFHCFSLSFLDFFPQMFFHCFSSWAFPYFVHAPP